MTTFKRPMLAASLLPSGVEHTDENILSAMQRLKYPVLVTIKKDGIRAIRLNRTLLSRTLKQIPNKSICERAAKLPGGYDMELWNPVLTYDEVESIVMSREHPRSSEIQFHILDSCAYDNATYEQRCWNILKDVSCWSVCPFEFTFPAWFDKPDLLFAWFRLAEIDGHEGICFRTPDSPYKQGRSTLREQYLVKLCRYLREEVTVVGLVEQMENCNRTRFSDWSRCRSRSRTIH